MSLENEHDLRALGYERIANYSRYMIKDDSIVNIIRKIEVTKRAEGRYQLVRDDGTRSPVHIKRLKIIRLSKCE